MDKAHRDTNVALAKLERRVVKVYSEAQKDLQGKLEDHTRRFKVKDKIYQKQLKAGKITEEQYQAWLRGQVFQGKQWKSKLDQITTTLTHADVVAQKIINGEVNGVFANNANWLSYTMEHGAGINFGFDLYDSATVGRLLRENPQLLPKYRLDIPKDQRWNQSLITRQITQGIIQGERLDQIAKRMEKATDHDKNLSLTRARTAMTGAQNAGRQESMTRAQSMGIKVRKQWLSTLDGHTRTQHARLDGQSVEMDKPFQIDGYTIRFPGDPQAAPAMVYNCRCTMTADLVEYPDSYNAQRYDNIEGRPIKDMTYQEWEQAKRSGETIPARAVEKPVETVEKPKRPNPLSSVSSGFKPSKTVQDAQAYADRFVSSYKSKYSGNVSYKGMDVDAANQVNEVLEKVLGNYQFKRPLGNITSMNFRENKWKSAVDDGIAAAYQWGAGEGTLYINQKLIGSKKLSDAFFKKSHDLMDYVLENSDQLLESPKTKAYMKTYITRLRQAGRQVYAQSTGNELEATIVHECGHLLDDKLFKTCFREREFNIPESMAQYAGKISAYSNTNNAEYIAESFTAYWYGDYEILDPKLVKIFDDLRSKK